MYKEREKHISSNLNVIDNEKYYQISKMRKLCKFMQIRHMQMIEIAQITIPYCWVFQYVHFEPSLSSVKQVLSILHSIYM